MKASCWDDGKCNPTAPGADSTTGHLVLAIKVRMTQDCTLQQGMLDMMLMLMVTGVLPGVYRVYVRLFLRSNIC